MSNRTLKPYLVVIVLISCLLTLFSALSCTPASIKSPPVSPVTTPVEIPGPTSIPEPSPVVVVIEPTPAPEPEPEPVMLPDLDASYVKKTDDRRIVIGFENAGEKTASDFSVELSIRVPAYTETVQTDSITYKPVKFPETYVVLNKWTFAEVPPGDKVEKNISMDEIIKAVREKTKLLPGKRTLRLDIDTTKQVDEMDEDNNFVFVQEPIVIANAPIPRREPKNELERKINEAFDNFTVYTDENKQEVIDMAIQGPLKPFIDAGLDMSKITIKFLEYDDFNKERERILGEPGKTPLRNLGFYSGNRVVIQNGLIAGVLPTLVREVSGAYYSQKHLKGFCYHCEAGELDISLAEAYCVQWLVENCNWASHTNVSYDVEGIFLKYLVTYTGDRGMRYKDNMRVIVEAISLGYPENPRYLDDLLKRCFEYVKLSDPLSYVNELDVKMQGIDMNNIKRDIEWKRMVDKEGGVSIPSDVLEKIAPKYRGTADLDTLMLRQDELEYPLILK